MSLFQALSFVEISEIVLKCDTQEGAALRCCNRRLQQYADQKDNAFVRYAMHHQQHIYVDAAIEQERLSRMTQHCTRTTYCQLLPHHNTE